MDLWQGKRDANRRAVEPLAARMRPRTLDEFAGQQHFLGPGKLLRRMLEADRLTSVLFYGPPGTGKTSLAELIAQHTRRRFERANAAAVGVKDVRDVLDRAIKALEADGIKTIFFLDEIHRFNKAQQDVLLGDVERGVVTLIGATTENPFFTVNSALVSRSQVFQFQPLSEEEIAALLRRAIADRERGLGELDLRVSDEAIVHWAVTSDGDARRALMALEIAVLSESAQRAASAETPPSETPPPDSSQAESSAVVIDLDAAEQSIQQKAIQYDKGGDLHYDAASALIKSMRGSDPDAAVYWLARMLHAGEDPRFIARRVAILASEDIGNADPRAVQVAAAAYQVTERVGMPECRITLAQAVIYMATAPKSNASYVAIEAALDDVRHERTIPVPRHLQQAHPTEKKRTGAGTGYAYAHHGASGYVEQEYLGVDKSYYTPTDRGYETRIKAYLDWIAAQRGGD
jgi:putative ATPase